MLSRIFMVTLVALAMLTGSVKAAEYPKLKLIMGHVGAPTEINLLHRFAIKFKEEVEKKSGGNIVIEVHPAGELGGERDMVEGLQYRTLDLAFATTTVLANFVPEVTAFDFPFLIRDEDHAAKVYEGAIGEAMGQKVLEKSDIYVLTWASNGIRHILNAKRPIHSASDLKGIKIRTAENKVHMAFFRTMGADPTPMSATELFTALQQGVVDAMEGTLTWIVPAKFYETAKNLSLTRHLYAATILAMNGQQFGELPKDVQSLLKESAMVATRYQRDYLKSAEEDMVKTLEKAGVAVVHSDKIDFGSFQNAAQKVYDELGGEYKEIIEQIRKQ
ncbi:C4-dicarboxylate ABC transporter substrate-binding protein [Betaproteobacteria bacterium]|nr:C4-dicarboxylate ABC transporter substrate-binding protein [Betaproteobacteria bacterium]